MAVFRTTFPVATNADPRLGSTLAMTLAMPRRPSVTGLFFPGFRAIMGSAIQEHHDNLNTGLKGRAENMT